VPKHRTCLACLWLESPVVSILGRGQHLLHAAMKGDMRVPRRDGVSGVPGWGEFYPEPGHYRKSASSAP